MEDMREVDVVDEIVDAPEEVVEEKKGGFLNSVPKVAKGALAVIGGIFVAGAVYGIKVYIAARKNGYTDIPKPGDATDPVTDADFAE